MKSALLLKPLFGADDKPLPTEGVLTINVKLKSLSVKRVAFVEFLSKMSKFGSIVTF